MDYDVIVLGGGPAGFTAALYAARANKNTLVLLGGTLGGQMAGIPKLENYPGFAGSGLELAEFMKKQAESFGAKFKAESCTKIDKIGGGWRVAADGGELEARAVIIATGASPKKLDIEGAKEFSGKGVSYCATCDGFFYKDKDVAVYGGGNSALNDALYLANLAKKVYIIYRKEAFTRAEDVLVERVADTDNIECMFGTEIESLAGNESGLSSLKTKDGKTISISGLFVAIGHEANTDFLDEEYARDQLGKLAADGTRIAEGLFVAGDVRSGNKMQICVAAGWGCEAAMDAIAFLNKK
ncbi:MAG: FAD-dependent oxidoreductase [Rickettsiales bacterium]|jgi:thioredoxin reductase (NADPH)|nr:FAD-dependent oxidoreductase [Rickettsiales bacterium]